MKHPHLVEKKYRNATAFPFTDFCTQLLKESFNVAPLNICAQGVCVECGQSFKMFLFHKWYYI